MDKKLDKNALFKRIQLYQNWNDVLCDDYQNKDKLLSYYSKVTYMIRGAKRKYNFKKLGRNLDSKSTYETIGMKIQHQQVSNHPDLDVMNEYFANSG